MASSLQEQLQRLAAAAGISSGKALRGKPSLLYTFQEAADVGIQDIYAIAVQGFDQLCRIDPRFQSYRKTLFSQSTQTLDRDQQTAEINAKLDASIAGFCHLLSSYFLLPAAFKTLEYLIRRFKVNEMNIPALMHAALPYHATNEFVRLVQTLRLDNNNAILFKFIAPMQKSRVALPRELLVQRCLTDRSLLRFVCDAGQELGSARVAARAAMPFLAALLCEVVAAAPAVDESLMAMLLPYIIYGLSADVSPDYRAAIYMVLVQLATRATFTSDLISAIVLELCKSVTPAGLPQVLLVLCHLAVTQPELSVFPENAFKHLAKLPALAGELGILVNKGASRSHKLLALLSTAAATHVIYHENYARLMDELLATVPLGAAATPAAETLLAMAANTSIVGDKRTAVIKALHTMDLRHPDVTEKAVNAALQKLKDNITAVEKRKHLSSALQEAFTGSLRAPMLEAGTTLALAVDAASAGIRRLALEKLDAIASGSNNAAVGGNNEDDGSASRVEAEQVLRGALLRRLSDEHPAVVQTVLHTNTLLTLPPAALLESLSSCLATALLEATKKGASKGDRAASRGIARKIIKLLAGEFITQNPEEVDKAAELLLTTVLAVPHTRKVAETAVKRGGKVGNHPLLQGLENADIDSAQLKAATLEATAAVPKSTTKKGKSKSTRKKEQSTAAAGESSSAKGYDDNLHNTVVIQALASKAAESTDAQRALAVLLGSTEPRTKALALAVANVVLHLDGGAHLAEAVLQRFSASSEMQNGPAESNDAAAVSFDETTGLADGETLLALASGTLHPRQVQPAVVLTALRVLPSTSLKALGFEGLTRLFTRLCALPSASWGQHLEVLVARASEIVDSVQILADLWGAPAAAGNNNTKVKVSALQLWTHAVVSGSSFPALSNAASPTSKTTAAGRGKTQARAAVLAALPRLLRVLGHTEANLRNAGVEACATLAAEIDTWWGAPPTSKESGALNKDTAAAVLNSIVAQAGAIKSDSEAAESLLRNSLEKEEDGAAPSPGSASKKSPRGGSKKKTSAKTYAPAFAGVRLALDSLQATNFKEYLLKELPKQHGPAGLDIVPLIIQVVHDSADPVALLLAAKDLLGTFALQEAPHLVLRPLRTSLDRSVAALLVELYNDVAMTALLCENGGVDTKEGNAKDVIDSLLAMLRLPGAEGSTDVRRVALAAVTPVTFASLPEEAQRAAFVALVAASTQDSDQECRDAAHAALVSLPLTADILIPLLVFESDKDEVAPGSSGKTSGAARRKQRRASHEPSSPTAEATPTTAGGLGAGFPSFLATLEVLQWKDDVENAILLVSPLQNALDSLLNSLARHAAATREQNNGAAGAGDDDDEGQQGEQNGIVLDDNSGDSSGMQAEQAYAMQLTLALLHTLARHHVDPAAAVSAGLLEPTGAAASKGKKKARASSTSDTPFNIEIAVRCAQNAPDAAVRSAALSLVGTLAAAMPQAALGHVLTVVSVVGDASSELIDAHSSTVAAQCLGAVVTAWMSSGGDAQELVNAVIGSAAAAPAPRRLPLLSALAAGLPEISGMSMVLLALLNRHLIDNAAVEEAKKKKRKQAKDAEEDDEDAQWTLSAAKALLHKASYFVDKCSSVIQAKTLGSVLESAMEETNNNPAAPLVLISTAFVTTRLESIPSRLLTNSSSTREIEQEEGKELQAAYDVLMERALSQLQKTGELSANLPHLNAAAAAGSSKNGKVPSPEFLRTSMKAIYALMDALRHVMTPAAYISGLVGLIGPSNNDKVRRRALSLISTAVRSSAEIINGGLGGKQREPDSALVTAALAAVGPVTAVLSTAPAGGSQKRSGSQKKGEPVQQTTELTRQVALGTLGSLAQAFGSRHPQPFIAAVPAVLELTKPEQRQAVRGSALACVAALAQSLGRQIVPVLPPTVNAVLLAAENAAKAVSDTSVSTAAGQAGEEEQEYSDADVDINGSAAAAATKTVSEMASLELAASLSAVAALVDSLGAFLAPHLPQLFEVVLSPAVLACHQAHCSILAESIRTRLSREIPARLLLATLAESLDRAAAAGADAACALLGMLRLAIESMDSDAIASYHETVFLQLLRALDLRRLEATGPVVSAAADAVEAAALGALVELTMKLSETRFKPLFFRLVEWATATAPPAVDSSKAAVLVSSSPLPRAVALLAAANVLSERLRSVFTPYFQPLMDPIIAALGHEGTFASAGGPTKKKRKKSGAALLLGKDVDFPSELAPLEATLRLLAIRSLHRCLMHDTAGFLDEARFDRVLQPLVSQLHVSPDPEILPLLQSDSGLEAALGPEAKENLDIPARAVVACLAQMALAPGGSDGRWRPLNHAVLMATRAGELRTRLAALEGVAALANALQEEYLVLLPEALPFLAELLEDGQHQVEARATAMLRALETLSGEDLKEYLK